MSIQIPNRENKTYTQTNRSSILGTFDSTFGVDLQKDLGVLSSSPRFQIYQGQIAGIPIAFKYFDTRTWFIGGNLIYKGIITSTFSADTSTGFQTDYTPDESDLETFNGALCATTTDGLFSKAANTDASGNWTQRDTLSSGTPHMMTYFKKFNRLYYTDVGYIIRSIDSTWTTADPGNDYALTLETNEFFINTIESTSSDIWIGTINLSNLINGGFVFSWDGISAQPTNQYKINAQGVLAMCILNEAPVIVDTNGVIRKFTGYSFDEIARFPFEQIAPYNAASVDNDRFIHPNGIMVTKNNTILFLINNAANSGNPNVRIPSGIWEWSQQNGLVHVSSLTYTPHNTSTITDYGQNQISRAGAIMNVDTQNNNRTYFVGATYYTNASSTTSALFRQDVEQVAQKYSSFVTSWILSPNVTEKWQKLYSKYKKLVDIDDKIVVKYRKTEEDPTHVDITWGSTTSFVTSTDVTDKVGYEVEVLRGTGSGKCSHIISVTGSGPYTVALDETYEGVSGTAKARILNFTKLGQITSDDINEYKEFSFKGENSYRIQLKVCMQLTGDGKIFEHELINDVNKPSK